MQRFRDDESVVTLHGDICATAARLRAVDTDLGADFVDAGLEHQGLMPSGEGLTRVNDCESAPPSGERFGP